MDVDDQIIHKPALDLHSGYLFYFALWWSQKKFNQNIYETKQLKNTFSYLTAMPRLLGRGTTKDENRQVGLGTYFRTKPSCPVGDVTPRSMKREFIRLRTLFSY